MGKKSFLSLVILMASIAASAMTNDAILGNGDTFACDAFATNAKVACMPGVQSNYMGRTAFPEQPALVIYANQVVSCNNVGGKRDIVCSVQMPGGPGMPGMPGMPGQPPMPPPPPETRKAFSYPDYNCLQGLPQVNNADDLVSNAFFRSSRVVDRCESSRDKSEIRRMEGRGFTCTIDNLASNQSNADCVQNLVSKVTNQNTVKGSHRRILETQYCATQTYNCVRQQQQ